MSAGPIPDKRFLDSLSLCLPTYRSFPPPPPLPSPTFHFFSPLNVCVSLRFTVRASQNVLISASIPPRISCVRHPLFSTHARSPLVSFYFAAFIFAAQPFSSAGPGLYPISLLLFLSVYLPTDPSPPPFFFCFVLLFFSPKNTFEYLISSKPPPPPSSQCLRTFKSHSSCSAKCINFCVYTPMYFRVRHLYSPHTHARGLSAYACMVLRII